MPLKSIETTVFIGVPLAVICWLLLLFAASGYYYEDAKSKHCLFTICFVFYLQFLIGDPIKFVLLALWRTFFNKGEKWKIYREGIPGIKMERDEIQFLQMRVAWGKSRLSYNWLHRDEALNLFYKNVTKDLILYGRYFISLIILVVILNEPLKFYHSNGLRKLFTLEKNTNLDVSHISSIDKLYDYLEENIANKLRPSDDPNSTGLNWIPDEMSKLIGVVRLEQVRLRHRMLGLGQLTFENRKFLPGWKPYEDYPYEHIYWRIYEPWVPANSQKSVYYDNIGFLAKYPMDRSYVTLLTRRPLNNIKLLEFLRKNNWLDRHTSAVFIDFTVYNVDANLFALCRITTECTPFGSVIVHMNFESAVFLLNWKSTENWYWIVLLVYTFLLVAFSKPLVLKAWYGSFASLFSFWNFLDLFIVVGNVLIFVFVFLREEAVVGLIRTFSMTSKEEYVNFRSVKDYSRAVEVLLALLVFCATLRVWKVLLFARVFRLYLRTLELGAADIFWALLNIMVFLIGLMLSSYMVNGPSRTASHAPLSLVHILSFSLGYSERVNPMESSQIKTKALGLIIYALMMFVVTLVLLNMLITLICIHYLHAKEEERSRPKPKITYWEFLRVEYSPFFLFLSKLRQDTKQKIEGYKCYQKFQSNVTKLGDKLGAKPKKKRELKPSELAQQQATRLRRLRIMTDILMTQTDVLNRRLADLDMTGVSEVQDAKDETQTK